MANKAEFYFLGCGLTIRRIAIVVLSAFVLAVFFLWGVYVGSKDASIIGEFRAVYPNLNRFQMEVRAKSEAEVLAKSEAEVLAKSDSLANKRTREALIARNGGFKGENLRILSDLGFGNGQSYLYADLDFILDKNPEYCPGLRSAFFKSFPGHHFNCFRIVYKFNELNTYSILVKSVNKSVGGLLIYNHGHGGFPSSDEGFAKEFIVGALSAGYDVLFVSMPFTGVDEVGHVVNVKTWDGWGGYNPSEAKNYPQLMHGVFELLDTGKTHYIRYFVDSAVVSSLLLKEKYNEISYMGLSGGATVGLNVCALLKNLLSNCILAAGVMPAKFRLRGKSYGDAEQVSSGLLRRNTVVDLVKELANSKTKLNLLYNTQDNCCFSNPEAENFRRYLIDVGLDRVGVFIRESNVHGYDPSLALRLLGRRESNH